MWGFIWGRWGLLVDETKETYCLVVPATDGPTPPPYDSGGLR